MPGLRITPTRRVNMSEEHEENRSNWTVQQWTDYAKAGNKDLRGANLEGARLKGADLLKANLEGHDIDDLRKRVAGF